MGGRVCGETMYDKMLATAMRTRRMHNLFPLGVVVLVVSLACISAGQQADIQNLVTSGNLEGMRWPNFSDYRASLQKFYEPTGYAPAWVREGQPVPQALSLIERARPGGLRRFAVGKENPRLARPVEEFGDGAF